MSKFRIGRGTTVSIAPLRIDDIIEPVLVPAITTATTLAAKGAVSITIAALGAGVFIPKFAYLAFITPTGNEVLVQLNADAVAAATTLTVFATPQAIAIGSVARFPLRLANRGSADLDRSGSYVAETTLDDAGWESGIVGGLSGGLDVPGSWSPLDASYLTCEYQWLNQLPVFVWLQYLPPNALYSVGTIYKGVFYIVNMPLKTPADGIVMGDISMRLSGVLTKVDPLII